ncbi:MAG: hypothetical protein C5B52_13520 [Bacteroidetes bacterium]|nr:MAG: hypothetical protein C5B52_13520 [Bacteroidota bacterium]
MVCRLKSHPNKIESFIYRLIYAGYRTPGNFQISIHKKPAGLAPERALQRQLQEADFIQILLCI